MARFCVGREDDADEAAGPSSSRRIPKRQKLTITPPAPPPPQQPPPPPPPPVDGQVEPSTLIDEEELDAEEEESEYEIEGGEEESVYGDNEEEEEEDDENDDDQDEENHQQQLETSEELSRDGSVSVTLTDPDVLDCPICLEPLSIPVFQCENGHIACSSCCIKTGNRCPSCTLPIGYNRCRGMEKVLESVKLLCRNTKYGCKQMVKYSNKHEHENMCIFAPCSCPILVCNFVGSSRQLYSHFRLRHSIHACTFLFNMRFLISLEKSQRYLILQESHESIIFVLKHFSERHGSAINVVCIAPSSSSARFSYDLIVKDGDTSIKLQSSVENIPKWVDCPPVKKFLLVPNYYTSPSGHLKLAVRIWKHKTCPTPGDQNCCGFIGF
ncbi:hypothetical protein ACH5RR_011643 [Cinchona calisaya]|uniref:RING-type E3 ubiquitin transferase n=1 Tax=Cinchona calisaya TaxID=153742 RepID=A0ABD3A814_9GENT